MASIAQSVASLGALPVGMQSFVPQSSFIALLEYDQNNLTLTTHLKSGAIYQHKFVLSLDFENLKTSQNHGSHWTKNIKGKKLSVAIKKVKTPKSEVKHRHYGR